jgi:pimeloyl-ACP methyl ester carboxylesterase
VEDVVAGVHTCGERSAVVIGHDVGSAIAATAALLRPDVVRARSGCWASPTRLREGPADRGPRHHRRARRLLRQLVGSRPTTSRRPSPTSGVPGSPERSTGTATRNGTGPTSPPAPVPGCGHRVQRERPDDVNQLLVDWLQDLPLPCP